MGKIDDKNIENKNDNKTVGKSFFKKVKNIKKEDKPEHASKMTIIGSSAPDSAVIIRPQNPHMMRLSFKSIVSTFMWLLLFAIVSLSITFLSLYHVVNIPVNGSNLTPIQNMYYVSREYQPDTSNLNSGDKVYQMSLPNWVPYQPTPKEFTYKSRLGNILHVTDKYGHSKDIEANDVDFIR